MKIKRLIPAGGTDQRTTANVPYLNMEEKLKEYFLQFQNNGFLVPLCVKPILLNSEDLFTVKLEDIIGYVKSFSDEDMEVEITNKELIGSINPDNFRVMICFISDKNNLIKVHKVERLVLTEKE